MRKSGFLVRFPTVVVAMMALAVAACASLDQRPPEEAVVARAQQRWDALVKGDLKAAYGYLSPGSRAVMDQATFDSSIRRGFWKSAKVDKAVCGSPQTCDAQVTIEYEFRGTRTKTPLRETWIREGSDWWLVQK
jgi:hypothetical protein